MVAHPNASLVAVVDPDREARTAAHTRFAALTAYETHDQLFATQEVDAVVVATPHAYHFAHARAALEAGAHVLIEKPMVLHTDDGRALMQLAGSQRRQIVVGYPLHYNRQVLTLRTEIASGRLGSIELAVGFFASMVKAYYSGSVDQYAAELGLARMPRSTTYSDPQLSGGGQAQTQLTHLVSLLLGLFDLEPTRVGGTHRAFGLEVDLADAVIVEFDNGAIATLSSTGGRPPGHRNILQVHICGEDGLASLDIVNGHGQVRTAGGGVIELPALGSDDAFPVAAPVTNLIDLALGTAANASPPTVALRAVAVIEALYRSAANGGVPVALSDV